MVLSRIALLVVVECLPLVAWSLALYVLVVFVLAPAAFVALAYALRQKRAPRERALAFRNIVIAHRGGQAKAGSSTPVFPENSMAAFRWASSEECGGADAFELDVWLSKDKIPMVNHDPNIFRHFDGRGDINEMTKAELKAIPFLREPHFPPILTTTENSYELQEIKQHRTAIDPKFIASERMPTLEEVVHFLETEAPHMKLMIEVKERADVRGMCRALKTMFEAHPWMYERAFVASFNPIFLYFMRRYDANIVTSFLFINEWTKHLIRNARAMHYHIPLWIEYNFPLRWTIDDLVWALGTTRLGMEILGANITGCEVKALSENQIRLDRQHGNITSTWVANGEHQKEWLLRQSVTVITDVQFGGGSSSKSPRPQIVM